MEKKNKIERKDFHFCVAGVGEPKEDYIKEKIEWTPIEYFNNKVVCELIESKRPPGIFCVLDDVCATLHAVFEGADFDLQKKLNHASKHHEHYETSKDGFIVHHYAGKVSYDVVGFCDKNRDVLFPDLVQLMQTSRSAFVQKLFPEEITSQGKSRPTTAGSKIRTQANALVDKLTNCRPHYVRCIKPNETKKSRDWNEQSVRHQVEYLGLKENIRVRRAGFAYRRPFQKFLYRYGILTKETRNSWPGDERSGVEWIMKKLNIPVEQYQLGLSKVFIKAPETLFMLEEQRERKYNYYARVIQKAFKKYFAHRQYDKNKLEAANLLHGKKQRRRNSLNRNFLGDYIGIECRPTLQALAGRREKIIFAEVVKKYDRNFKPVRRDLLLTSSVIFLIGREKVKKGGSKGSYQEVIKRRIEFEAISEICLSTLMDDFVVIRVKDQYDSLIEIMFKTEFLFLLSKKYFGKLGKNLNISFSNKLEFKIKKEGWGGGGTRFVNFIQNESVQSPGGNLKVSGKLLIVTVPKGLPNTSTPSTKRFSSHVKGNSHTNQIPKGSSKLVYSNDIPPTGRHRTPPPPPSEPAPPNQPIISSFRFNYLRVNKNQAKFQVLPNNINNNSSRENNNNINNNNNNNEIFKTPDAGVAGAKRASLKSQGKPKPPLKPKPVALPKCKALYDYTAQDLDEISFQVDDVIDIIKEHEGGWWQGRLRGKEGLFPSNYVEKMMGAKVLTHHFEWL